MHNHGFQHHIVEFLLLPLQCFLLCSNLSEFVPQFPLLTRPSGIAEPCWGRLVYCKYLLAFGPPSGKTQLSRKKCVDNSKGIL